MYLISLFRAPEIFIPLGLIVIFSICSHEFMHAYIALREGDPTAADRGHLTLNPLRQMGMFSLITFLILGIAWGQVPVNPLRLRSRWSHLRVALAGPLTNVGLFLIFCALSAAVFAFMENRELAGRILMQGAALNLVLAFFNLLPVPGLDGAVVAWYFYPRILQMRSEWSSGIFLVLLILLFACFDYITAAAEWVSLHLTAWIFELLRSTR